MATPSKEYTTAKTAIETGNFNDVQKAITPTTAISLDTLQSNPTPIKVPEQTPTTQGTGLQSTLETNANTNKDAFTSSLEQAKAQAQPEYLQSFQDLIDSSLGTKGTSTLTNELYSKTVDPAQTALNDINNQILAEQQSARRQVEQIQKNAGGGLTSGMQNEINRINRESISKQADLAVIQLSKQGQFDSAKAIADRAVAAQVEQDKQRNDILQFIYTENKDQFTKAEQNLFETQQADRNRQLEQKVQQENAKYNLLLQENSPSGILDRQLKQAQIEKINAENAQVTAAGNFVTPPIVNPETGKPDPTGNVAKTIAALGAKDNTALQSILGVLSATQSLAESNPNGTFEGTGPFAGLNVTKSSQGRNNEQYIEAINLKTQQWASGAALTEAQTKKVEQLVPKIGDTEWQIKDKVNGLTNFMLDQARGTLAGQGINYAPGKVDFFDTKSQVDSYLDNVDRAVITPYNLYQSSGYNL